MDLIGLDFARVNGDPGTYIERLPEYVTRRGVGAQRLYSTVQRRQRNLREVIGADAEDGLGDFGGVMATDESESKTTGGESCAAVAA
jgi:hypothetical protein